ncbi:MAG: hypothetical protein WC841_05640 [Candidatus Shapirobacteria bacterium]|jgi:hypothetical protein
MTRGRVVFVFMVILSAVFLLRPEMILAADNFCPGFEANSANPKINTALGCVPVKTGDFATWLLTFVFGIAGGIAFLLMIYGFILISTTGGDPKKMQGAQETVSSAITGLVVCIFSIFLLRLFAVNILRIPGIN